VLSFLTRQRLAPVVTTVAAWLVAYGVVAALLVLFGHQLARMPLALRALVMSGVLVALMINLVMPLLNLAVARWLRGSPPTHEPRTWLPPRSGHERRA
jgi:antibiotic biosynthesis monooxygenase (ABM) superfamily enzyme